MWYNRVVANLSEIPNFIAHFETELTEAKRECRIGGYVEINIKELPVKWKHKNGSKVNVITDSIKFLVGIIKLKIKYYKKL